WWPRCPRASRSVRCSSRSTARCCAPNRWWCRTTSNEPASSAGWSTWSSASCNNAHTHLPGRRRRPFRTQEPSMIPGMPGDSQVYLNGEFTQADQAKISVLDRGFIFGDGIYEVVPVYNGKPFRMAEHLDRLDRSLKALRSAQPMARGAWIELIGELARRAATPTCIVYLQVTRGVYKRDHAFPPQDIAPTVFGMATVFNPPSAAQREKGVSLISIPDERWLHCEIKSVSLLGNVLARQQAVEAGVDE